MSPTQPSSRQASVAVGATNVAAMLYDLDGTLVNTDPLHFQVWQAMLQDVGLAIDAAFYQTRISGRLNPAIVKDLLPHLSVEEQQTFVEQKEARFREQAPELTPLGGLIEVIHWAEQQGLKQGVVTNAPTENVYHMLKALHLEDRFDQVVISEVLGVGKPDPAPYTHALKQFNLLPQQAIAFEDSPSGIRSAVAAGINTVGIASTHDPQTLYSLGATLVVSDFSAPELRRFLGAAIDRL